MLILHLYILIIISNNLVLLYLGNKQGYLPATPGTCTPHPQRGGVTIPRSTSDGLTVGVTLILVERTSKPSKSHICRYLILTRETF